MKKILYVILFVIFTGSAFAKDATHEFLAISDIHFNPFYACKKYSGPCPLAKKLLDQPYTDWSNIFEAEGSKQLKIGFNDTNNVLFQSLLASLKKKNLHPKFIILPGDFLAHHFPAMYALYTGDKNLKKYHQFVNKTFEYIAYKLKKVYPQVPMYPALGNNDSYGGDYFNAKPDGEFYHELTTANLWLQFIIHPENRADFIKQFPVGGYCEVKLSAHNRLVVLNTILFSLKAKGPDVSQSAVGELKWLSRELGIADEQGNKVWLLYHIPFGVNAYASIYKKHDVMFWHADYQKDFFHLLNRYHSIIKLIITGHLHMDGFRLYYTKKGDAASAIIDTYVPAVSPVYGNNPAFKVYEYDSKTFDLTDYKTYYLNTHLRHPRWLLAYDFDRTYQPLCTGLSCLVKTGMLRIVRANTWTSRYYRYYYAVGRNTQFITHGYWRNYRCAMINQREFRYQLCLLKR